NASSRRPRDCWRPPRSTPRRPIDSRTYARATAPLTVIDKNSILAYRVNQVIEQLRSREGSCFVSSVYLIVVSRTPAAELARQDHDWRLDRRSRWLWLPPGTDRRLRPPHRDPGDRLSARRRAGRLRLAVGAAGRRDLWCIHLHRRLHLRPSI